MGTAGTGAVDYAPPSAHPPVLPAASSTSKKKLAENRRANTDLPQAYSQRLVN
ncbi:hypothetical protein J6K27_000043 [Rhodococcus qingshengii]|uniref:hypothetical protein n=1 Tax=Rhodococcus qingshengii TaxID=334542 RepID=UPI001AEFA7A7|nr:hypothetical protein [Rhodococcus qingshengii]QTS00546.1 hypothetical protein J6K27_000043 [Rhodococcus qingshengii]